MSERARGSGTGAGADPPVLRDGTPVAAWMFKANPEVWDVVGFLRTGADVDSWRMAPSYRIDLVRPGHRCVLWVTGARTAAWTPGVWALGEITSRPFDDVGDAEDHRWRDLSARDRVRPHVMCRMDPVEPIPRSDLAADPRFASAEILRRPRMGSPLAVTARQLSAIDDQVSPPAPERR